MKLQYKSYAKLNLFIRILEKRLDGYHNLQSIFEKINLFDQLTFESRRDNKILIKSNIKALEEENIIIDVINLMKELVIAFGLLLFIEGILYALFPSKMKNMLKTIEKMEVNQLRIGGLIFALIGFAIVWYYKS